MEDGVVTIGRVHATVTFPARFMLVAAVPFRELTRPASGRGSGEMRAEVATAREAQAERFREEGVFTNSRMRPRHLKRHCALDAAAETLLAQAVERLGMSARGYGRILKVARTIADLDGADRIGAAHVAEAIQYRSLDRSLTGSWQLPVGRSG